MGCVLFSGEVVGPPSSTCFWGLFPFLRCLWVLGNFSFFSGGVPIILVVFVDSSSSVSIILGVGVFFSFIVGGGGFLCGGVLSVFLGSWV